MSIIGFIRGYWTKVPLMERMFRRLDVEDVLTSLPHGPEVLRRAAARCAACDSASACEAWLDDAASPREAPRFCRNHDLIERLRRVESDSRAA